MSRVASPFSRKGDAGLKIPHIFGITKVREDHLDTSVDTARDSVLIVEDDPMCRDLYETLLRSCGYDVHSVANGTEALSYLHQSRSRPSVVLLDLGMPGMDGRTFLECQSRIRAIAELPVLVVSGTTEILEKLPGNVKSILTKPVDLGALLGAIKNCVEN